MGRDSRLLQDLGGCIRRGKGDYRSYERLSGRSLRNLNWGGYWSVWIGRRVKLGNDDPGGSAFMEDLLDMDITGGTGSHIWYQGDSECKEDDPVGWYAGEASDTEAEPILNPASSDYGNTW